MKKFGIYFLLSASLVGMTLNSCDKDEFSEEDAMNLQDKLDTQEKLFNDSIEASKYRVSYTVNVVDASTSTLKSGSAVNAITGAVVKLVQDTAIRTATVDASGIATFSNLKPGYANVNITLPNYSEVNYTVDLSLSSNSGGRQAASIIPLIPIAGTTTGTITGRVTLESDLTNLIPEPAANIKVIAMIDPDNSGAIQVPGNGILAISYDKLSLSATTDANGYYTMSVPTTINGLKYKMIVPDFTVDQRLLQLKYNGRDTSGVLTIPASFGNTFAGLAASTIDAGVSPVIIKIDAPGYSVTEAEASAVIDNSNGIDHINITSNGGLYDQAPMGEQYSLVLDNSSIVNENTANAIASFNVNPFGRVTAINITGAGSKYLAAAENFALTIPYCKTEAVVTFNTDAAGVITGMNAITTAGKFYVKDPADVIFSYNGTTGSGAAFTPIFGFAGGNYYISGVTVTNGGTGYPASATNVSFNIKASGSLNQAATGTVHMTSGSLSAIKVTNEGANYIGDVAVVIGAPNIPGGTQATASPVIKNGKIAAINIDNPGTGYTSAPSVTVKNKAEAIQAIYKGTANNGNVSDIFTSVNQGNGYLTVPNVTILPAISGAGSGASAYAKVSGGKVTSLTLVNAGSGYRGNTPSTAKTYTVPETVVTGSTSTILNINLGTGKRLVTE